MYSNCIFKVFSAQLKRIKKHQQIVNCKVLLKNEKYSW